MSNYLCERCHEREAQVTLEAGRFCAQCDKIVSAVDTSYELLQRAYKLLSAISQPFTPVERYDVGKWLEDARQAGVTGE